MIHRPGPHAYNIFRNGKVQKVAARKVRSLSCGPRILNLHFLLGNLVAIKYGEEVTFRYCGETLPGPKHPLEKEHLRATSTNSVGRRLAYPIPVFRWENSDPRPQEDTEPCNPRRLQLRF